jgi:hypothetical protein
MMDVRARLRALLESRRLPTTLAIATAVLLVPTLWLGLVVDDFFHRLAVEGRLGAAVGPLDLFSFVRRTGAERAHWMEIGFVPWWIGPTTEIDYYRPLASLTHAIDYAFWPRQAWLMHLENLAWYAALVAACAAFYRPLFERRWVAGLAAFLYAFDHAHAAPVAWVANRNAVMSTLFGVLSLTAHQRWRATGKLASGAIAGVLFALALLSAESGIAIAGYLVAFALCVDRASTRARLLSLAPYGVVAILWRILYRALGHGVVDSGTASDALVDPIRFAGRALQFLPILLASDIVGVPGDALGAVPSAVPAAAVASYGVIGIFVLALWPALRRDRTTRFLAVGTALSALPPAGAVPSDRYLFWVGIGIMGLVAQVGAGFLDPGALGVTAADGPGRFARIVGAASLVVRGMLSPLLFVVRPAGPGFLEDECERIAATLPTGPETALRTVVLIDAPFDLSASFLPIMRMAHHEPVPQHMYLLRAGLDDVSVVRTGARSIEVLQPKGWIPGLLNSTFRTGPFRLGEHLGLDRMSADVLGLTATGQADRVEFTFPVALEDPSLVFMTWGPHGLEPFAPPAVGETVRIDAPPPVLPRPVHVGIKNRAIEPD